MTDHDRHGCGNVGAWIGMLCAGLGVVSAFLMVQALGIGWVVGIPDYGFFREAGLRSGEALRLPAELFIGLIALFVAAAVFGKKAGVFLCTRKNDLAMNVLIGLALAFGSIAIAVWTGIFVGLLSELDSLSAPSPVGILLLMFGPLLLILLYGGIPAILLGVLYGFLVRHQLRQLRP